MTAESLILENRALPWGRIAIGVLLILAAAVVLLWESRGKALAEAETQKARALEIKSAYDQVLATTHEQNAAVEQLRKDGAAAAVKVKQGQASGSKVRAAAEDQAARLRSLPVGPDSVHDHEQLRAALAAMGSAWREGK